MPGYDKSFKGYAYDVEGAKAKLKEAGLEGGFETELYVANTDPQPRSASQPAAAAGHAGL
jgi:peptide/nickel transport system substrate-binding protein